jgi:hypothetical protein
MSAASTSDVTSLLAIIALFSLSVYPTTGNQPGIPDLFKIAELLFRGLCIVRSI